MNPRSHDDPRRTEVSHEPEGDPSRTARRVLITGNSSGLGRGLSDACLERGDRVYGMSRRGAGRHHERLRDVRCDLSDLDAIPAALDALLGDVEHLDLVFLNAGAVGEIRAMTDVPLDDLRALMDLNVWANKVILDRLHAHGPPVRQVVATSSGASVLGNRGWDGYSLSKAALNMLVRLYAHEFPDTHLNALAPGLVDSEMMDHLCQEPDPERFPALRRIREARAQGTMPGPDEAAARVLEVVPDLRSFASGEYVDIRQIVAPEEYEELLRRRDRTGGSSSDRG